MYTDVQVCTHACTHACTHMLKNGWGTSLAPLSLSSSQDNTLEPLEWDLSNGWKNHWIIYNQPKS